MSTVGVQIRTKCWLRAQLIVPECKLSEAGRGRGGGGEGGAQLFVGFCLPRASNFAYSVPPNQPVHLLTEEVNLDECLLKS